MLAQRVVDHDALTTERATGATGAGVTLTIPAPPAGQKIYIGWLRISRTSSAALAGSAILSVTSTNILSGLILRCGNEIIAGGTSILIDQTFPRPLSSDVAGTAVTITAPAPGSANIAWEIVAGYYYR